MTPDDRARDRDTARAAYEALRQHMLAGLSLDAPLGLMVLLRQGVASWLQGRTATGARDGPAATPRRPAVAAPVLDDIQAGVVRVLAGMALVGWREA